MYKAINKIIPMTGDRRTVVENFLSLSFVQGINYIIPLITFPYLVRILGISNFGLYSFIYAFTQYFIFITDYGFNLTATRDISVNRLNKEIISEIFISVLVIKSLLFLICVLLICSLCGIIPILRENYILYLLSAISILGNVLFPMWYYQGLEKTKYLAILNFIAKVIATVSIFIFVKNSDELWLVLLIQSLGVLLAGLLGFVFIFIYWPIRLKKINVIKVKKYFVEGWNVFLTLFSSTLVNNTNTFILGIYTDNNTVGVYSIAEKIVRVFIYLSVPINNAVFPRVSMIYRKSVADGNRYLNKVLKYGTCMFIVAILFMLIFTDELILVVTGSTSTEIKHLIWIMAILPLTIFWDNIYGTQTLINNGKTKEFLISVLIPGILSLCLSLIFVPFYGYYATAIIFLVSEIFILVLMVIFTRRNGLFLVKEKYI